VGGRQSGWRTVGTSRRDARTDSQAVVRARRDRARRVAAASGGSQAAFTDGSRRPYRQANRLPPQLEAVIVRLKREYPGWGAPKIREKLRRQSTGPNRRFGAPHVPCSGRRWSGQISRRAGVMPDEGCCVIRRREMWGERSTAVRNGGGRYARNACTDRRCVGCAPGGWGLVSL